MKKGQNTMTDTELQPNGSAQAGWDAQLLEPFHLPEPELAAWRETRETVRALSEAHSWSMAEMCRRAGVKPGTFSPWYAGKYNGVYANVTAQLRRWLDAHEEARQALSTQFVEPGFVETAIVRRVLEELLYAQELPGVALVSLGPGMGKTTAIREVLRRRPHTYCITLSPSTRTVPAVSREIAGAIGIASHPHELRNRIGEKLRRNGRRTLLMVDEAQNLGDDVVQELRHWHDIFEVGLALLGNEDVHTRWGATKPRDGYGQTHRRIDGRVRAHRPSQADIDLFVGAWGIADPAINKLLRAIGTKPGAFGQITKTLKRASIHAAGADRVMTAEDVSRAWENRAGEVL